MAKRSVPSDTEPMLMTADEKRAAIASTDVPLLKRALTILINEAPRIPVTFALGDLSNCPVSRWHIHEADIRAWLAKAKYTLSCATNNKNYVYVIDYVKPSPWSEGRD